MKSLLIYPLLLLFVPSWAWADTDAPGQLWADYQAARATQDSSVTNPLVLQSSTQGTRLRADVYSEIGHGFKQLSAALGAIENWCDFMPLNLNIKACVYQRQGGQQYLTFYAGRKFYQAPEETEPLRYAFSLAHSAADYFKVVLSAGQGPYGTQDYNITVQAMPLREDVSLIHVHTSYTTSVWSRLGTSVYLATLGSDKEGFTIEGYDEHKQPRYVKGVRGIIERNTVRYYFALLAQLQTQGLPQGQRFEQRLHTWFDLTQTYPRQLYELDKEEYLAAKRRERQNQILLQEKIATP